MKKILMITFFLSIIFCLNNLVYADTILISPLNKSIRVQQNGEFIDFTDSQGNVVEPQIINDRTMVPFRKIFNSLGVTDNNIYWDDATKTVKASKDNMEIILQIDNPIAKKTFSGETNEIKLDSSPVIVDGRTLVPIRFIAESMEKKVGWD